MQSGNRIGKQTESTVVDAYSPANKIVLNELADMNGQLMYKGVLVDGSAGGGGSLSGVNIYTIGPTASGTTLIINKPYDISYSSAVISIQEFITDGLTNIEEVIRVYDNNSASSFQPNPYFVFDDTGISLVSEKTYEMDLVRALDDTTNLYSIDIDLSEWKDWQVV